MLRCHRCGVPITLYVLGQDYCRDCRLEMSERERQDARRADRFGRYRVSKDLTPYGGAAA